LGILSVYRYGDRTFQLSVAYTEEMIAPFRYYDKYFLLTTGITTHMQIITG